MLSDKSRFLPGSEQKNQSRAFRFRMAPGCASRLRKRALSGTEPTSIKDAESCVHPSISKLGKKNHSLSDTLALGFLAAPLVNTNLPRGACP